MPNGPYLPDAEFELLERPLLRIDKALEDFAATVGGRIERNYHNSPGRMILVEPQEGLTEQIDISHVIEDPERGVVEGNYTYAVGVAVWKDVKEGRLASHKELKRVRELPTDEREVTNLLKQCWAEVQELKRGELKLYPAYDPYGGKGDPTGN